MCIYSYNWEGKERECDLGQYFETPLIEDKDNLCLFHSMKLKWKKKNCFWDRLSELFIVFNNNASDRLFLHGVHFVGMDYEKLDKKAYDSDTIFFDHFVLKKKLSIQNSVFYHEIHINYGCFEKDIIIQNCIFIKGTLIENSIYRNELSLEGGHFKESVNIRNNIFKKPSYISNCLYEDAVDFMYNTFRLNP